MFLTFHFRYPAVANPEIPAAPSSANTPRAPLLFLKRKQSLLPVAGVDVPLCLPFPLGALSLLLARGGADGSRAGADAARPRWVALGCRVPVGAAPARHWERKGKRGKTKSAQLNKHFACFISTSTAELYFRLMVLRSCWLWFSS